MHNESLYFILIMQVISGDTHVQIFSVGSIDYEQAMNTCWDVCYVRMNPVELINKAVHVLLVQAGAMLVWFTIYAE